MEKEPLMSRLAEAYEKQKYTYFVTDGEVSLQQVFIRPPRLQNYKLHHMPKHVMQFLIEPKHALPRQVRIEKF